MGYYREGVYLALPESAVNMPPTSVPLLGQALAQGCVFALDKKGTSSRLSLNQHPNFHLLKQGRSRIGLVPGVSCRAKAQALGGVLRV